MEQVRDLNMDADDMQVVLSAISGVSKRIREVAQTHKPLFGGEHFLQGAYRFIQAVDGIFQLDQLQISDVLCQLATLPPLLVHMRFLSRVRPRRVNR